MHLHLLVKFTHLPACVLDASVSQHAGTVFVMCHSQKVNTQLFTFKYIGVLYKEQNTVSFFLAKYHTIVSSIVKVVRSSLFFVCRAGDYKTFPCTSVLDTLYLYNTFLMLMKSGVALGYSVAS